MRTIDVLDRDAWGGNIRKEMSKRIGARVAQGQVYVTLKRLLRRLLIEHRETRLMRGSPPLKVYQLTTAGRRALAVAAREYAAAFVVEEKVDERAERKATRSTVDGGSRRRH